MSQSKAALGQFESPGKSKSLQLKTPGFLIITSRGLQCISPFSTSQNRWSKPIILGSWMVMFKTQKGHLANPKLKLLLSEKTLEFQSTTWGRIWEKYQMIIQKSPSSVHYLFWWQKTWQNGAKNGRKFKKSPTFCRLRSQNLGKKETLNLQGDKNRWWFRHPRQRIQVEHLRMFLFGKKKN